MTLRKLFSPAEDECAVLSVCAARRTAAHPWQLAYGSLLLVPRNCAEHSWLDWARARRCSLAAQSSVRLGPSLCIAGETWLLGRTPLELDEAERWFAHLGIAASGATSPISLPAAGPLPELQAQLIPPDAPLRICPNVDSPVSRLIAGLGRPVQALLWNSVDATPLALPQLVQIDGADSCFPSWDIAGLTIVDDDVQARCVPTRGIVAGRVERRAWLGNSRGGGDREYHVEIRWDERFIDLVDLELLHLERLGGEIVRSSRIRLDDLDLTAVRTRGTCSVRLPAIGRRVLHELLLCTVEEGEVLDRVGPHPLVERAVLEASKGGSVPEAFGRATRRPAPDLEETLQRREQLQVGLEAMLQNAAQTRMVVGRRATIEQLKAMLAGVRGELLIQDPYFGSDPDDWRMLDDVAIPVRVLTRKSGKEPAPIGDNVQARCRRKARMHDRIYLWERGGLSVGGSPSTFGKAPLRLARLRTAEVSRWRAEFERLWALGGDAGSSGSPPHNEKLESQVAGREDVLR